MNALFIFSGAVDLESSSNNSKLSEFWRLDREIHHMEDKMSYKALFHSLEYAILNVRAKQILKQLEII